MLRTSFSITSIAIAFLFIGNLSAQTPSGSPPNSGQVSDPQNNEERYRIGFQDTLAIHIFRHPDLSQKVNVNTNGTINLFRIERPIIAVCKTESELAEDIAEAYRKDYLRNPEVQVTAVEQKSQAFSVVGAVVKPGYYFINRKMHLLELLAFAEGPNREAGSRVLVARTGSRTNCKETANAVDTPENVEVVSYKLRDILEGKSSMLM
ncbi:MAG: polysaccharide biosynthesis/export family protein, partial [Pyrinomonadaceae bacterium]